MNTEKLYELLKHEGVVAIATQGEAGPHLVNTWNTYIQVTDDGRFLIPAGLMNKTEANVAKNSQVLVTLGTRAVDGFNGPGTGCLITGKAAFINSGAEYETVKEKFPWARTALAITIDSVTQTL